jgi:hypothetical protein
MEVQRWRYQVQQLWCVFQLNSTEVSVVGKVALQPVPSDTQPIVSRLQWQMQVRSGLSSRIASRPLLVTVSTSRIPLCPPPFANTWVYQKTRIQVRINSGDVVANHRFQPAFRLWTIECVPRVLRQQMTITLQILHQVFESTL